MTSYTSEIVVGSTIVAALGVAAYIVAQLRPTLMLTAVFLGYPDHLFSVPATPTTQVYLWMEGVKDENKDMIGDVDTSSLVVYKLKEPVPVLERRDVLSNRWNDLAASCAQMNPIMNMGYYFENLPKKHIHVIVKLPTQRKTRRQAASDLHDKAWGKPWPHSKGTISKTEISGDESGSVDDDDVEDALADKLKVPLNFDYRYFTEIRDLKNALGTSPGQDFEDVLVVCEEYEMLRQALETESKHHRAIVVTGHPGIGKSTFLFYLLLHRLENRLPTAVQFGANYYYIFDEQGAAVYPVNVEDMRLEKCWALTDSNVNVLQPCETFQSLAEYVILILPPEPKRWKEWIKQAEGRYIISDLPSVPEIAAIVKELRKRQTQLKKQLLYDPSSTLSLVGKWGPSTRNIIRSMECAALGRDDPIEEEAKRAVMRICNNPSFIFEGSFDIKPEREGSSVIFLCRTPNDSVTSINGKRFIPTPHLLALFEEQRYKMATRESL